MAILKIYNPIVAEEQKLDLWWFTGVDGVCFKDIDAFLASVDPDDNTIDLRLHCLGGDCAEAWAITDKLRATGKTITATIEGQCASAATIVLLAASVRRGARHASLLIHEPYYPEFTLADAYRADDLDKLSGELRAETSRFLDFYVERTGTERAVLEALMKEDKFITMDEAKNLGFIHEIIEPKSASAAKKRGNAADWATGSNKQSSNSHSTMAKNASNQGGNKNALAAAFATIANALGINTAPKSVNYELNTADGDTITINKPEGEDPAVGDEASPDGEHKMPDGTTIVVEGGVITEIKPADDNADPDTDDNADPDTDDTLAAANARIAELEAENEQLRANAKTDADKRILNLVAVAGGEKWLKSAKSNYKPAQRDDAGKRANANNNGEKTSKVAARLAELREKNATVIG